MTRLGSFLRVLLLVQSALVQSNAITVQNCGTFRYALYFLHSSKSSFAPSFTKIPQLLGSLVDAVTPVSVDPVFSAVLHTDIQNSDNTYRVISSLVNGLDFKEVISNKFAGDLPVTFSGDGSDNNAFTAMYRIAQYKTDTNSQILDGPQPAPSLKILIVFDDGIPQFKGCYMNTPSQVVTHHPEDLCCEWDSGPIQRCPTSSDMNNYTCIPYQELQSSPTFPSQSNCPIDLPSVSSALKENGFYVIYVNPNPQLYTQWDFLVKPGLFDMAGRFQTVNTNYYYSNLVNDLVKAIDFVACNQSKGVQK